MSQPSFHQQSQQVHHQQNAVGDIYNYNQTDPLQDVALYQESSRRAKILVTLGVLMIIGGFVIFGASLALGASTGLNSIPSLPTQELAEWAREQMNQDAAATAQSSTLALMGFGAIFAGMIVAALGSWRAQNEAYRRRAAAQRR